MCAISTIDHSNDFPIPALQTITVIVEPVLSTIGDFDSLPIPAVQTITIIVKPD